MQSCSFDLQAYCLRGADCCMIDGTIGHLPTNLREMVRILDEELPQQGQQPEHIPADGSCQAELVSRCLCGDELAFARIVDLYGDLLLRTAYLLVQDEESAKDIVQESLFLAWKNMHQLREPSYLRAWLLKIIVNRSTTLKQQWARRSALLRKQLVRNQIEQTIQVADMQRGKIEDTLDAWNAIEQLPLNQRVVLVLFYYHKMTMPEIASMLQTSENTLRKRLLAGLDKVRKILQIESMKVERAPARVGFSGGGTE